VSGAAAFPARVASRGSAYRPEPMYGLRVPATFADTRVWYVANALAGRDMVILGAVVFVVAVALPRTMHVTETA
jgi:uncharacterized membrane protein